MNFLNNNYKLFSTGLLSGCFIGYKINDNLYGDKNNRSLYLIPGYERAKFNLEKELQQTNDYISEKNMNEKEIIKRFLAPSYEILLLGKAFQVSYDGQKTVCVPNETYIYMMNKYLKQIPEDKKEQVIERKETLFKQIQDLINS